VEENKGNITTTNETKRPGMGRPTFLLGMASFEIPFSSGHDFLPQPTNPTSASATVRSREEASLPSWDFSTAEVSKFFWSPKMMSGNELLMHLWI